MKSDLAQMESNPQAVLMEALHQAAYNGALGNPLVAPESALKARPRLPRPARAPLLPCMHHTLTLTFPLVPPRARPQSLTPDDFYEFVDANYTAPRIVLAVRRPPARPLPRACSRRRRRQPSARPRRARA